MRAGPAGRAAGPRRCPCDSSIRRKLAAIASSPIGTLMKKIQCQLACSVRRPPTSGPIASASAETPAQIPIAIPRWCGREGGRDDRERRGVHQRGSDALHDPRRDQDLPAVGEAAGKRRSREDGQPDDEDQPPSEQVGELAAAEHQRGEGERVAGHDPLELGQVEPRGPPGSPAARRSRPCCRA